MFCLCPLQFLNENQIFFQRVSKVGGDALCIPRRLVFYVYAVASHIGVYKINFIHADMGSDGIYIKDQAPWDT